MSDGVIRDPRSSSNARRAAEGFDREFAGRRYRVLKKFELPDGQAFVSPLGHKGRRGYILQEVDPKTGGDLPVRPVAYGKGQLDKAHREHGSVAGWPDVA